MKILVPIMACLMLAGCADYSAYNQSVAEYNLKEKVAFGEAMAACKDDSACKVGVAMFFSGNLGEVPFAKPETVKDYAAAFLPYASLGLQFYDMYSGGSGSSEGISINGSNNSVSGVGNTMEASGESSISATLSSSTQTTVEEGNRDYSLGGSTDGFDTTVSDTGVVSDDTDIVEIQ